jgi:hypothetical protein
MIDSDFQDGITGSSPVMTQGGCQRERIGAGHAIACAAVFLDLRVRDWGSKCSGQKAHDGKHRIGFGGRNRPDSAFRHPTDKTGTDTPRDDDVTAPHRIKTLIPEYQRCVVAFLGACQAAPVLLPYPTADPWDAAVLQLGDDFVGDFGIEIGAACAGVVSCGARFSATGAGSLSPNSTRHGQPARTFPLDRAEVDAIRKRSGLCGHSETETLT